MLGSKDKNCTYIFFSILLICINIFLVSIISLSPVYFAFVISMGMLFILFSFYPRFQIGRLRMDDKILILLSLLLCVNVTITTAINNGNISSFITYIFSVICFTLSFTVTQIPKRNIKKTFYLFKYISLLLFVVEVIYRFSYSQAKHSYFYFYDYKHNSIMFPDTNATAVCIEFFLAFLLYLKTRNVIKIYLLEILIGFVLLFLTFSRAALFGLVCFGAIWFFLKCKSYIVKYLMLMSVFIAGIVIITVFIKDGSFITKLDLYAQTFDYIQRVDYLHLFIGNGLDSSVNILTRYGHTFVTLYIVELGINNFILLLALLSILVFKTKYSLFLIVPYIVSGASYMPFVIPFFYLYLGLIYNLEYYRNDLFDKREVRRKKYERVLRICFTNRR